MEICLSAPLLCICSQALSGQVHHGVAKATKAIIMDKNDNISQELVQFAKYKTFPTNLLQVDHCGLFLVSNTAVIPAEGNLETLRRPVNLHKYKQPLVMNVLELVKALLFICMAADSD